MGIKENKHQINDDKKLDQYGNAEEYIRESEQLKSQLMDHEDIIASAEIGIWHIYLKEGELPRMTASRKMLELLGAQDSDYSEEELYASWFSGIKESSIESVNESVATMIENGIGENTYAWMHPTLGEIFVRCGGTSQKLADGTIVLRGYHMDVTKYVNNETRQKQLLADTLEEMKKKEKMLEERMTIISSMADMYFCSFYLNMDDGTYTEIENHIPQIRELAGDNGNSQASMDIITNVVVVDNQKEEFAKFVDLSTLNERLKGKQYISMQFEGVFSGWVEGSFIVAERDDNDICHRVIWCVRNINEQKNTEQKLMINSYYDQLTGLYNRRMYEDDIANIRLDDNLVYVSIDVNGLKEVNDNSGHDAGDELLVGSSECLKRCLGPYGRVYRIGGDEFCAIINSSPEQLEIIKNDLIETEDSWEGEAVKSLSFSCGFVTRTELPEATIVEIRQLADKRMYEEKKNYYSRRGVDRKGQHSAFKVLCALYTKILKINLTTGAYNIITMNVAEKTAEKGFADNIFDWLNNFAQTGQVHPDDLEEYYAKTTKEYLSDYFKQEKNSLGVFYKRKIGDTYKTVVMEMAQAEDYSPDNETLFLYVKEIDK